MLETKTATVRVVVPSHESVTDKLDEKIDELRKRFHKSDMYEPRLVSVQILTHSMALEGSIESSESKLTALVCFEVYSPDEFGTI